MSSKIGNQSDGNGRPRDRNITDLYEMLTSEIENVRKYAEYEATEKILTRWKSYFEKQQLVINTEEVTKKRSFG